MAMTLEWSECLTSLGWLEGVRCLFLVFACHERWLRTGGASAGAEVDFVSFLSSRLSACKEAPGHHRAHAGKAYAEHASSGTAWQGDASSNTAPAPFLKPQQ